MMLFEGIMVFNEKIAVIGLGMWITSCYRICKKNKVIGYDIDNTRIKNFKKE